MDPWIVMELTTNKGERFPQFHTSLSWCKSLSLSLYYHCCCEPLLAARLRLDGDPWMAGTSDWCCFFRRVIIDTTPISLHLPMNNSDEAKTAVCRRWSSFQTYLCGFPIKAPTGYYLHWSITRFTDQSYYSGVRNNQILNNHFLFGFSSTEGAWEGGGKCSNCLFL